MPGLRVGIADHLGWAVAVTATIGHQVVDRRRIELIEPGLQAAPIHHVGGPHQLHRHGAPLDDDALATLVGEVRASVIRTASAALDDLAAGLGEPVLSMSLRSWPADFPADIAAQRRVPYEARADPIMYRQLLADEARRRGWGVPLYDAKTVEAEAVRVLAAPGTEVLDDPRVTWGAPWSKDHRVAYAATIVAS